MVKSSIFKDEFYAEIRAFKLYNLSRARFILIDDLE